MCHVGQWWQIFRTSIKTLFCGYNVLTAKWLFLRTAKWLFLRYSPHILLVVTALFVVNVEKNSLFLPWNVECSMLRFSSYSILVQRSSHFMYIFVSWYRYFLVFEKNKVWLWSFIEFLSCVYDKHCFLFNWENTLFSIGKALCPV